MVYTKFEFSDINTDKQVIIHSFRGRMSSAMKPILGRFWEDVYHKQYCGSNMYPATFSNLWVDLHTKHKYQFYRTRRASQHEMCQTKADCEKEHKYPAIELEEIDMDLQQCCKEVVKWV